MDSINQQNKVNASYDSSRTAWQAFGSVLDGINPKTKLNIFGAPSLMEGTFLGEGKDARVYTLQGNQNWVIKVFKTSNTEFVSEFARHINLLADDESLKIPKVVDLGDGRILQPYIHGTPKANQLWGGTDAQSLADELTRKAKLKFGVNGSAEYIHLPDHNVKLGIDPSYENFRFNESGKLIGWIDPIFTVLKQHSQKLSIAAQATGAPLAVIADYKDALKHLQLSEFDYLTSEQKRDYAHICASIKLQQRLTLNIEPSLGYADFKAWAVKAGIPDTDWTKLDPTPVSKTNVKMGLPIQGIPHTLAEAISQQI